MSDSPKNEPGDGQAVDARATVPRRRRKRWRVLSWTLFILFDTVVVVGIGLFLASVLLAGRDLPAPDWTAEEAGKVLSRGLGGARAEVGAITLRVSRTALPEVVFRDVTVRTPNGAGLLAVPALQVSLDRQALWRGQVQPRAFRVDGARIDLRRKIDGTFDFGMAGSGDRAGFASLDAAIEAVWQAFELPGLAPVERVEIRSLQMFYEDARAGRAWRISDGSVLLTHSADALSLSIALELPEADAGSEEPASVALRLSLDKRDGAAEASALVENVAATDIAAHSPALSWLEPLQARVSGAMIVGRTAEGGMGPLNGTLEIGAGVFQPETSARPIPFDSARTYFGYRPGEGRISFEEIDVRAPDGSFAATGYAYLEGIETRWPTALVGQFRFSDIRLDPPGMLREPAHFDSGAVDVKLSLAPFAARIGQLVLRTADPEDSGESTELRAEGLVTADSSGWHVALDIAADRVRADRLLALWPVDLVPMTRRWIERRLISGLLHGAHAGVKIDQGKRPDVAISFQFEEASLRPMLSLPPITGASGHAAVGRHKFAITLEAGQIEPPEGGLLDISGSTYRVSDMRPKPATGELLLAAEGTVTAALSLLDQKPFRFLSNAGQPVALAEGRARVGGRVAFPMKQGLTGADVSFRVSARSVGLRSEVVVPERVLEAGDVALLATPDGLELTGTGALDGVPVEATFELPFGSDRPAPSVEGVVEIGERFVRTFGIGLPEGSVSGAGQGRFSLVLPRGEPIRYALTSNLRGVGLSLPTLGWSKGSGTEGKLDLSGRLGERPSVDRITLEAAGLTAQGSVTTTAEGGLEEASFSRVSVGGWLDAPVTLRGRGRGRDPAIAVRGGRIDIRKTSMGSAGGGRGGSGPPLSLALDRLVISDGISLTGFRGELTKAGGYSGQFSGAVNGQAQVNGTLVPGRNGGTAVRIRSANAGAVFKAAGLFEQASGGAMTLILQPRRAAGEYDGQLEVENVRVRSASGLTALVNAISVVGLIDELNGAGIVFSDVEASFRLTPSFVHVTRASGTGPSLGISMEGVYDMVRDRLDMQGVFSPVYMVNSIGQIFTRKGEGLVGFTYTMRGPSANPQVAVNPLSALTPGMFREIFRAPPPKPRNGG